MDKVMIRKELMNTLSVYLSEFTISSVALCKSNELIQSDKN